MKRGIALIVLIVCIVVWMNVSSIGAMVAGKVSPKPIYTVENSPQAGQPDYPVSVDKQLDYWIANCPVSNSTTQTVDRVLEDLNAIRLAQTVILCLPEPVSNPTSYAERFLRYMGLGMPDGPSRNNGFVFLVLQDGDTLDVHYAVGLGLPELTAAGLTPLNTVGEERYAETKSLDEAILAITNDFNTYVRNTVKVKSPSVTPVYGTPSQEEEEISASTVWAIIGLILAVILITETLFSFSTLVFGSQTTFALMAWPWHAFWLFVQLWASRSSSGRSYSGGGSSSQSSGRSSRSGSGGGSSHRGN